MGKPIEVTKENPCPHCGKPDYWAVFKKGGFWVTQAGQIQPSFCLA